MEILVWAALLVLAIYYAMKNENEEKIEKEEFANLVCKKIKEP